MELSLKLHRAPGFYRLSGVILQLAGESLPEDHHETFRHYVAIVIGRLAQLSDDLLVSAVKVSLDDNDPSKFL